MREEVRDIERLQHIFEAANVLIGYKEHHTLEEAQADPIVYYGLVKHVEIIGEAVYKLTLEFRATHNEVNWDDIERMRHVLVHGYYKNSSTAALGNYCCRHTKTVSKRI